MPEASRANAHSTCPRTVAPDRDAAGCVASALREEMTAGQARLFVDGKLGVMLGISGADLGVPARLTRSDLRTDAAKQQGRGMPGSQAAATRTGPVNIAVNIIGATIAGVDLVAGHELGRESRCRPGRRPRTRPEAGGPRLPRLARRPATL